MKEVIIVILSLLVFNNEAGWKIVRNSDAIKVYKKPTAEGYDEIKIQASISSTLDEFVQAINDADAYQYWVYGCSASNLISSKERNLIYYETITDMPFPIQDRYLKVKSTQSRDGLEWKSHSVGLPSSKKDQVAIENFESRWHVQELPDETILVNYTVKTEPGGFIPAWLYNLAVDRGPYYSMKNLKDRLESKESSDIRYRKVND